VVDELGLFGVKLVDAVAGDSGERVVEDPAGTLGADAELVADRIEGHAEAVQLHDPGRRSAWIRRRAVSKLASNDPVGVLGIFTVRSSAVVARVYRRVDAELNG
jgi:hypothetical protein